MNNVFCEGSLLIDFKECGKAERFDSKEKTAHGMKAVDFIVESKHSLFLLEIKDYQQPNAPIERRKEDLRKLLDAAKKDKTIFVLEMGEKIKDSLLRLYAEGYTFAKRVTYLLLLNLDEFGEQERGHLKEKLSGHIPTGLNDNRFKAFNEIVFDVVNDEKLRTYGIICTEKHKEEAT
jgi:hypothetical protein